MKVENGDTVHLEYTGKLETGEIFDTSDSEIARKEGIFVEEKNYKPLDVKVGEGQIIKGLDEALVGMEKEEEKEITVLPEEGYGMKNPALVQELPISAFEQSGIEPRKGIMVGTSNGMATVTNVSGDTVELDFNHPLAEKTLVFDIKIVDIEKE